MQTFLTITVLLIIVGVLIGAPTYYYIRKETMRAINEREQQHALHLEQMRSLDNNAALIHLVGQLSSQPQSSLLFPAWREKDDTNTQEQE